MNKQEFSLWASALRTYYPKENLLPNKQAVELWFHHLQGIEYKVAQKALESWVIKNKWSPTIADVLESTRLIYWKALERTEQGSGQFIEIYNRLRGYDNNNLLGVKE